MKLSRSRFWQRIFRTRAEDILPHQVTHQRVYIVPTKRGWAFLLALLLMLIASVNYALSLGYALSFLLSGLFAASLLHTYRNVAGLRVIQIEGGECFTSEALPFQVTLANDRTQARHGIRISNRDGEHTGTRIEAEQHVNATLTTVATHRGVQKLGRLTLQSDWPLGLWTCWSYLHAPAKGLVFPQPEDNPPPLPSSHEGDPAGGDNLQAATQGDVAGLRSYVPGDSLGSIAWKSAARAQGLHVRVFETDTAPSQALLSLQQTDIATLEEQLSRLCAWVLAAESKLTDYALYLPGEHLPAAHGKEQRIRALRALAQHGHDSHAPAESS